MDHSPLFQTGLEGGRDQLGGMSIPEKDEACAFCSELIRSCENVLGEVLDSSRFAG